jgi:hypothetical protein
MALVAWRDGSGRAVRNQSAGPGEYTALYLPWDCCEGEPEQTVWKSMRVRGYPLSDSDDVWLSPFHAVVWRRTPTEAVRVSWRWIWDFTNPTQYVLNYESYLEVKDPSAFALATGTCLTIFGPSATIDEWQCDVTCPTSSPGTLFSNMTPNYSGSVFGEHTLTWQQADLEATIAALAPWGGGWTWPPITQMGVEWDAPDATDSTDGVNDMLWECPPSAVPVYPGSTTVLFAP